MSQNICVYVGNFSLPFCTEVHLARTLEDDLGWKVERLQENQVNTDEILACCERVKPRFFLYTRTWGMRGDGLKLLRDLAARGIPTVSYHLDLYFKGDGKFLQGRNEARDGLSSPFWQTKYVFSADGGSDNDFRLAGINHTWMRPGVFRQECYKAEPVPKFACDVAFVGSMDDYHAEWLPYRQELKRRLIDWYGPRFRVFPGRGNPAIRNHELNQLYASVKVVVGDSLCPGFKHPRYWSDRIFETIGRGGFMIHPRIEGIEDELRDGEHVVLFDFNDWDGLKQRIDHYLANEAERLRIRDAGHEFVKANCTYTNRLRAMLQHVGEREGWVDVAGVAA